MRSSVYSRSQDKESTAARHSHAEGGSSYTRKRTDRMGPCSFGRLLRLLARLALLLFVESLHDLEDLLHERWRHHALVSDDLLMRDRPCPRALGDCFLGQLGLRMPVLSCRELHFIGQRGLAECTGAGDTDKRLAGFDLLRCRDDDEGTNLGLLPLGIKGFDQDDAAPLGCRHGETPSCSLKQVFVLVVFIPALRRGIPGRVGEKPFVRQGILLDRAGKCGLVDGSIGGTRPTTLQASRGAFACPRQRHDVHEHRGLVHRPDSPCDGPATRSSATPIACPSILKRYL